MKIDQSLQQEEWEKYMVRLGTEELVAQGLRLPTIAFIPAPLGSPDCHFSFDFATMLDDSPCKKLKANTACPHADRKHYAKNMCSACYHKTARPTRAWKCPHSFLPHYAKGRCHDCYLNKYYKRKIPLLHASHLLQPTPSTLA